jgi:hypothetical protein
MLLISRPHPGPRLSLISGFWGFVGESGAKGDGVEIFPGRFQPEAGQRLRVTHQQELPFQEHIFLYVRHYDLNCVGIKTALQVQK